MKGRLDTSLFGGGGGVRGVSHVGFIGEGRIGFVDVSGRQLSGAL